MLLPIRAAFGIVHPTRRTLVRTSVHSVTPDQVSSPQRLRRRGDVGRDNSAKPLPRSSRRGLRVQLIMRRFAAHLFPLSASCAYRKSVTVHPHRNAKLDFTRRVEPRFTSVLDPLRERSEGLGAANAVTFLPSGKGSCRQSLTYADLAGRAQSVATALMQHTRPGDQASTRTGRSPCLWIPHSAEARCPTPSTSWLLAN